MSQRDLGHEGHDRRRCRPNPSCQPLSARSSSPPGEPSWPRSRPMAGRGSCRSASSWPTQPPSSTRRSTTSRNATTTRCALARVRDIAADPRVTVLVDRWDEDWTRWPGCASRAEPRCSSPAPAPPEHAAAVAGASREVPAVRDHRLEVRPLIRIALERIVGWGPAIGPYRQRVRCDRDACAWLGEEYGPEPVLVHFRAGRSAAECGSPAGASVAVESRPVDRSGCLRFGWLTRWLERVRSVASRSMSRSPPDGRPVATGPQDDIGVGASTRHRATFTEHPSRRRGRCGVLDDSVVHRCAQVTSGLELAVYVRRESAGGSIASSRLLGGLTATATGSVSQKYPRAERRSRILLSNRDPRARHPHSARLG